MLFVHPNTVRYRLRRVAELTAYIPATGRDGFTLWLAIVWAAGPHGSPGTATAVT